MLNYIARRLLMLIPVLLGVSFFVFTIMDFTPGDPVQMYLGANYTPEAYESVTKELGLDRPFLVRYASYVGKAVQGDFGNSYSTKRPVVDEIVARFPTTLVLAAASMLISIIIAIPLGVISAIKQNSALDSASMFLALFGVSMPNFWLGMMLIIIFAAGLGWFPSSGNVGLRSLVLPAITLSMNPLAMITRMTRSSMLETIRQDYIRTVRAKGMNEGAVVVKHALRNAMIPITTTVGLQFGFAIGSTVLVETVFSWPGIGRLLVDSIKLKDTPIVLAVVLILATFFTIVNLLIDILYAFFDPRIKADYKAGKARG